MAAMIARGYTIADLDRLTLGMCFNCIAAADRLTARQLLGLCAASQRFAEQCDQNAGVGQILGALAVKWEELL